MSNPRISVIVPTYNRGYCIALAIQSVIDQTFRDWELIVVDDGSTDDTADVVKALAATDNRVRYVGQKNAGVSAARNHGHRLAQGDYIAYLDSDDAFYPFKLELQLACMDRHPEIGMIFSDMDEVSDDNVVRENAAKYYYDAFSRFGDYPFATREKLTSVCPERADDCGTEGFSFGPGLGEMLLGNLVLTPTAMVRREAIERVGGFPEGMNCFEDYHLYLRIAAEFQIALIPGATITCRRGHADQLTASRDRYVDASAIARLVENLNEQHPGKFDAIEPALKREAFRSLYFWIAEEAQQSGQRMAALRYFFRSGRHRTVDRTTLRFLAEASQLSAAVNNLRARQIALG